MVSALLAFAWHLTQVPLAPGPAEVRPAGERSSNAAPAALRLRAVGDVMLGTTVPEGYLPPDDGAHLLEAVAPLLQDAELTFANLEGPLCDHGETSKCRKGGSCYAFRSPTRYGAYLKAAGIDLGSTANNHAGDFGDVCRRETEATLDALGITWSGAKGSIGVTATAAGVKVALVGFHTSASVNDVNALPEAKALVAKAKALGALVVVSFHGGAEGLGMDRVPRGPEKYLGENRGDLRAFAHGVIDAGADLVLGHGPHVLRGLELYQGHLIAYSLGNFATYGRFTLSGALGVGMVLEVELDARGQFLRGKVLPTQQEGKGVPAVDPSGRAIATVQRLSQLDFPLSAPKIDAEGRITP